MTEPVRILHIVGAMYPGGVENFIMNLYRHIDRSRYQFDFAVHQERENDYTQEIRSLGGRVYLLSRLTKNPIENLRQINSLVKENSYPVVIRHTANALVAPQLLAAKRAGAVSVCHSHSSNDPQILLHRVGRKLMKRSADVRIACSEAAGKWMYKDLDFTVIQNAIDLEKFAYQKERSRHVQEEFDLTGRHVYGNIANYIEVKNHPYQLQIYREIVNRDPSARILLVGEGELRSLIEEKVRELGLAENVILTGLRSDVADIMSCMDVLIFPSIFEGIPLTLIEAQAAGLACLISDTISKDVIVTSGLVEMLSIRENPAVWAKRALEIVGKKPDRTQQSKALAAAGYDIDALASWYEDFFAGCIKEKTQ